MSNTKIVERIIDEVESAESEITDLCSRMIQIPTVSPPGESRELVEMIKSYFDTLGINTRIYEKVEKKSNICAEIPGGREGKIIWLGHIDTVPPGDLSLWRYDPYGGEVVDGKIYGRGSSDTKGAGAAAMVAAKVLSEIPKDSRCSVEFWFTTCEEIGAEEGAKWLAEEGKFEGDICIVGDSQGFLPSDPVIDIGCKGVLRVKLKAKGLAAHGSTPFLGENAIEKLIEVWEYAKKIGDFRLDVPEVLEPVIESSIALYERRTKLNEAQRRGLQRLYHFPSVSLNIIRGGVKVNIVPESAEAHLDIRVTPGANLTSVKNRILDLVRESGVKDVEAEIFSLKDGIYENPESPIVKRFTETVETVTGFSPTLKIITGGTDGIYVKQISGIPCLGLSPGMYGMAHTTDEYVTIENLVAVAKIYAAFPVLFKP